MKRDTICAQSGQLPSTGKTLALASIPMICVGLVFAYWLYENKASSSTNEQLARVGAESVQANADGVAGVAAIQEPKGTLEVAGPPYPQIENGVSRPTTGDPLQRKLKMEFRDGKTGLLISVDTHLCLPGIDRNFSGGQFHVSDGESRWDMSFHLLGSSCPPPFRSQIPKTRKLLDQLQSLANDHAETVPTQPDIYQSLETALDAEKASENQQWK